MLCQCYGLAWLPWLSFPSRLAVMFSFSVLSYSHHFPTVVLLGVCLLTTQLFSSLTQHCFSRYSLAFSDTASSFIGDLRQFLSYLIVLLRNLTTSCRLFWPQRRTSATLSWEPVNPVINVLCLPAHVRSHYTHARGWCPCGTRASRTFHGVRFRVVDACL